MTVTMNIKRNYRRVLAAEDDSADIDIKKRKALDSIQSAIDTLSTIADKDQDAKSALVDLSVILLDLQTSSNYEDEA